MVSIFCSLLLLLLPLGFTCPMALYLAQSHKGEGGRKTKLPREKEEEGEKPAIDSGKNLEKSCC